MIISINISNWLKLDFTFWETIEKQMSNCIEDWSLGKYIISIL